MKCEFSKGPNNRVTCPSFPEIHYDKQASDQHEHSCAIIVQNIQEHHEGNWRCEFEIDVPEEDRDSDGLPVIIVEKVSLVARGYRYIWQSIYDKIHVWKVKKDGENRRLDNLSKPFWTKPSPLCTAVVVAAINLLASCVIHQPLLLW